MLNGKFLAQKSTQHQSSYIIEDLVRRNRLVMVACLPGEGKSLTFETMLYHVTYGAPFLGKRVSMSNVMLIDSENRLDILQDRFKRIKKGLENDGYKMQGSFDIQHYSGFLLDDKDKTTWEPIKTAIKELKPSLIMLDHLLCFHNQNENHSDQMKRVSNTLGELMSIHESSLCVMHHFNKNTGSFILRLRGSTAIYADTDAAYEIRTLEKNSGKLTKIGIIPQARKEVTMEPFRIKVEEGTDWLKLVYDGSYTPVGDPKIDDMAHRIYHIFLQDKNEKTVINVLNILAKYASDPETRVCLRLLADKGLLLVRMSGKMHKLIYRLPPKVVACPWCSKP